MRIIRVHCSLPAVTHAPFHASILRPVSQAGPMHESAGMGEVSQCCAALISEACMGVCCATSSRVNSSAPLVHRHDRVTRVAGRVGLMRRGRGRRGYWVTLYLFIFTTRLLVSLFIYASLTGMHDDRPPIHSAHIAPSAQAELSGACGQGL